MKKLSLILLLSFWTVAVSAQKRIVILDDQKERIDFFLVGTSNSMLKSDSNGTLILSKEKLQELADEVFTFHFSDPLAYLVYRTNLFYEDENKSSNKFIKYNKITVKKIIADLDGILHLRRKINKVNDD